MGHLNQARKNQMPTKPTKDESVDNGSETTTLEPLHTSNTGAAHPIFLAIEKAGCVYTDKTGRFPITSKKVNKYIDLIYDYDTNSILTDPLKNFTGKEILRAYYKLHS